MSSTKISCGVRWRCECHSLTCTCQPRPAPALALGVLNSEMDRIKADNKGVKGHASECCCQPDLVLVGLKSDTMISSDQGTLEGVPPAVVHGRRGFQTEDQQYSDIFSHISGLDGRLLTRIKVLVHEEDEENAAG